MKTNSAALVASRIVERLKNNLAPVNSTWGDQYPDAHKYLFEVFREDVESDIADVLRSVEVKPLT